MTYAVQKPDSRHSDANSRRMVPFVLRVAMPH
jgi:hypothetical protein